MKRSQAQDIWFKIKAFGEGVVIQRNPMTDGVEPIWKDIPSIPISDLVTYPHHYRIKPEPEEIWANKLKNCHPRWFSSEEEAELDVVNAHNYEYIAKRFVEADDA